MREESQDTNGESQLGVNIGLGIAFGIAFGSVFGLVLHHLWLGAGGGLVLGALIGVLFTARGH